MLFGAHCVALGVTKIKLGRKLGKQFFHYSALFERAPELSVRVNRLQIVLNNYVLNTKNQTITKLQAQQKKS